jgi:hypothetical protein
MRALFLGLVCLTACATPAAPAPTPVPIAPVVPDVEPAPVDPAARIAAAEQVLVEGAVRTRFRIDAGGSFEAHFVGVLVMEDPRIRIEATGVFGDKPVEVSFLADGTTMKGRGGAQAFELSQPPALREALGVGMMRMGLLHTLAMLVAGRPPDVPEGDVREWLVLTPQPGAPTVAVADPHHADLPPDPITFRTAVAGDESITATVWLEEDVLRERQQETRFEDGTMTVIESFESL